MALASEATAQVTIHHNGNSNTPNGSYTLDASNAATTGGKNVAGYYYLSGSGTVTGGKVTVTTGGKANRVYGAYTSNRTVDNNMVNMDGGTVGSAYGGYAHDATAIAKNNSVIVGAGSTITANRIYGGSTESGTIQENKVIIQGGSIANSGEIYGGYAKNSSKTISDNTVTINGGSFGILADAIGGKNELGTGTVEKNTVTVKNTTVGKLSNVYGGYSNEGIVRENKVIIQGGSIANTGYIYGGFAENSSKTISDNTVTIDGGSFGILVDAYGGYNRGFNGTVENNTVTVKNTTTRLFNVTGGYSYNGLIQENKVELNGGTVVQAMGGFASDATTIVKNNSVIVGAGSTASVIFGGFTDSGTAQENKVIIQGGSITDNGEIYGGGAVESSASDNTVTIDGGSFGTNVRAYGGRNRFGTGTVEKNTVTVKNTADILARVYGGHSTQGFAQENKVELNGGTVGRATGGYAKEATATAKNNSVIVGAGSTITADRIYGGSTESGTAQENKVIIQGGNIANNGSIHGGYAKNSSKTTSGNTVTIDGGSFGTQVDAYGGYNEDGNGTVEKNTVTVENTTAGKLAHVYGGQSTKGLAQENKVELNGGTVGWVHGGFAGDATATAKNNSVIVGAGSTITADRIYGGTASAGGIAQNNTVEIRGGTAIGSVIGGDAVALGAVAKNNIVDIYDGSSITDAIVAGGVDFGGKAINNVVNIHKGAGLNSNVVLKGLTGPGSGSGSGNTLNLHQTGLTAKNLEKFNNLNFFVQDSVTDGDIFLTLKDTTENTDIKNTSIAVGFAGSSPVLKNGEKVVLIKKQGSKLLETDATLENKPVTGMHGIAGLYDFVLKKQDDQTLVAVLEHPIKGNPQVKSLSEARLAAVEAVNRGADLANGEGMSNLSQATQNGGVQGFSAIGGGKYKTETGSHIDVNSVNLLVGAGTGLNNGAGKLTLGGFVEFGKGSYDSYNDFTNRPDVHASGDSHYYGVGLMAKQTFNSDWFVSGGLRVGKSKMDYFSADLVDALGNATAFDGKSTYIGANIGAGKTFAIDEKNSLTPYANLLYTHYNDMNRQIAGSTFDFGSVTSLRGQLGVNFQHAISEKSQVYANAAWEHEFRGTAKGRVLNFAMPEPTLKGNSGVIGAGFNLQPNENLHIDLGIQGTFGNRRGASAVGKFMYSF